MHSLVIKVKSTPSNVITENNKKKTLSTNCKYYLTDQNRNLKAFSISLYVSIIFTHRTLQSLFSFTATVVPYLSLQCYAKTKKESPIRATELTSIATTTALITKASAFHVTHKYTLHRLLLYLYLNRLIFLSLLTVISKI